MDPEIENLHSIFLMYLLIFWSILVMFLMYSLQPYDETYLKSADPPIKFLSFHSYLRKLMGGVDK